LALRRVFEKTVLADVMAAREEDDGVTQGRYHKFKANAADVALNLMGNVFAELLVLFVCVSGCRVAHLLDEVGGVVLDVVLQVDLPARHLLLPLLIPALPTLHQLFIIMMRTAGRTPLSYRSIAHLDDLEAQELAGRLGLSPESWRSRPKEENTQNRNGVVRRLEANELNFVTQETKIITDFVPLMLPEDRNPKIGEEERPKDIQNPFRTVEAHTSNPLKRSSSFIDDFLPDAAESERTREDYCRVWFEKLAL
jgi:hypothetical protein